MPYILFFALILGSLAGQAKEVTFSNMTYKEAKNSPSYVRFDMSSTKMGFITTRFTGFARTFRIQGNIKDGVLEPGARLTFATTDLDTDIDARNEKMWLTCLDSVHYPNIEMTLTEKVPLNGQTTKVPGLILLRGQSHPIELQATGSTNGDQQTFEITGKLSISSLGIPDPSIIIAKVDDEIDVTAHVEIPQK